MNRNIVIFSVIGLLVLAGLVYVFTRDSEGNDTTTGNNTEQTEQTGESDVNKAFAPLDMTETEFEATVEGTDTDGNSYEMLLQYDGEGRSRMSGEQNGTRFETIFTADAFYSCQGENCVKFPVTQTESAPFQPGEYVYQDEDYDTFRDNANYLGRQDCPAGTCDVWEVTEDGYTTKLYIDDNQRISQVKGDDGSGGEVTITYEFKDVTINIPANAQTITEMQP